MHAAAGQAVYRPCDLPFLLRLLCAPSCRLTPCVVPRPQCMGLACLLQQGRISGYRYDIRSDTDFEEVSFPPSPPPAAAFDIQYERHHTSRDRSRGSTAAAAASRIYASAEAAAAAYAREVLSIFGSAAPNHGDEDTTRSGRARLRIERSSGWDDEGDINDDHLHSSSGRRSRSRGGDRERDREGHGGRQARTQEGVQPRPYYFRMQQHMLSRLVWHCSAAAWPVLFVQVQAPSNCIVHSIPSEAELLEFVLLLAGTGLHLLVAQCQDDFPLAQRLYALTHSRFA